MGTEVRDTFVSMIGFARRSGKIVIGIDRLKAARGVKLLAVSENASGNLTDEVKRLAKRLNVPLISAPSLQCVGANVKAVGLTDINMVKAVTDHVAAGNTIYKLL